MTINKKRISILCMFMMLCVGLTFVGCKEEKEIKYDVTVMLVCQESSSNVGNPTGPILERWILTPEQSLYLINREYDGKKYMYYVYQYKLASHPDLKDVWFFYPTIRDYHQLTVFSQGQYVRKDGSINIPCNVIRDRGTYLNNISVRDVGTLKPRTITLNITVE